MNILNQSIRMLKVNTKRLAIKCALDHMNDICILVLLIGKKVLNIKIAQLFLNIATVNSFII